MGLHEPNYSDCDCAPDHLDARAREASAELLTLLVQYHPEQAPDAVRSYYMRRTRETPDTPDPIATIVALPTEDDRIAAWVQKQKALLPPRLRDWNFEMVGPSIASIQRIVCAKYNITRADIISIRRTADVVGPRQVAIYLSRKMTARSFPYIGGKFGGRDHTTCLHAVRKVTERVERDQQFAAELEALKLEIAGA